jgi:hypothetical protein
MHLGSAHNKQKEQTATATKKPHEYNKHGHEISQKLTLNCLPKRIGNQIFSSTPD